MAATFKFDLVSPERVLMSDQAEQVVIPGVDGQFTVLPGHAPVISALLPGIIKVQLANGRKAIYVKGGFVEVNPESMTVLAAHAFIVDEADPRQLDSELAAAEASLAAEKDDEALRHITRAIEELKALRKAG